MRDLRVPGQIVGQLLRTHRLVVGELQGRHLTAYHLSQLRHALAVGAIDQYQQGAVARQQGADGRLHGEGAGALQRHANMAGLGIGDGQQIGADAGGQRIEAPVPGAPVLQHGGFGGQAGGQRTGGKQNGFAHNSDLWQRKKWGVQAAAFNQRHAQPRRSASAVRRALGLVGRGSLTHSSKGRSLCESL